MSFGEGFLDRDYLFAQTLHRIPSAKFVKPNIPKATAEKIAMPPPAMVNGVDNRFKNIYTPANVNSSRELRSILLGNIGSRKPGVSIKNNVVSPPINRIFVGKTRNFNQSSLIRPHIEHQKSNITSTRVTANRRKMNHIFNKSTLLDLVKEIDVNQQLDSGVQELLLELMDMFIDDVLNGSSVLAKHRKGNMLELKDVQIYLHKAWKIWVPGFSIVQRKSAIAAMLEAYRQRTMLLKRTDERPKIPSKWVPWLPSKREKKL